MSTYASILVLQDILFLLTKYFFSSMDQSLLRRQIPPPTFRGSDPQTWGGPGVFIFNNTLDDSSAGGPKTIL